MNFKSSRLALLGVGAVLVTAGVAGCGGGDDEDSGPLTKDEFIAQIDQICADTKTETEALEPEFNSAYEAGDIEGAADILAEGSDLTKDALVEMEALEPPEEDQATIDEFVSLSQQQIDLGDQIVEAVRAEDDATVDELGTQADDLEQQSDALADDYGMVDCGSASSDS